MKRKTMYRGKRVDNGEWVYSFYWNRGELAHYIKVIDDNGNLVGDYEVLLETIGQFTERLDSNRNKIFEDDIVSTGAFIFGNLKGVIAYHPETTRYVIYFKDKPYHYEDLSKAKVIGNIFDNPKLIKEN